MYRKLNLARFVPMVLVLLLSVTVRAQVNDEVISRWESFDFASRKVAHTDLAKLTLDELKLVRGIVFGKHGRIFKDGEIRFFLESRRWYKPDPDFKNSMLNSTERASLDVIREAEARKHPQVEPGDMRWWSDRTFTLKQLGKHSGAEWRILRAEIEAVRGKRFEDEPWLQQYFDERYWYQPSERYDPKRLTESERKNITTIELAQRRNRNLAISPGDMEHFHNIPITEKTLAGLSLHELRLIRNEIYARHGRLFRTPWLNSYFYSQPWYSPMEDFTEPEVSTIEKKNIETIVALEKKIHDQLTSKLLTRRLLEGMFLEDARKMREEIYARHGNVFKDKWTQKYFESFDWYQADPNFNEATMTAIAKRNVATIQAYEKKALSVMSAIEG